MLFLYPVFFYKNILLSFMIVFLIANKIGSFGIRDEEEEEEEEEQGEGGAEKKEEGVGRVQDGEMDRPGCLLPERERERERENEREVPVISCVNVTMSPF